MALQFSFYTAHSETNVTERQAERERDVKWSAGGCSRGSSCCSYL